jgi:hypothetical protein
MWCSCGSKDVDSGLLGCESSGYQRFRRTHNCHLKPFICYLLLFVSMGWDFVSELRLPTGLLFIHQMIPMYWEPRWDDIDRTEPTNLDKNVSQRHFVIPHGLTREQTRASAVRNRLSHGTSFPPLNSNDVLKYWGPIKRSYQSRCRNICNTGHSGDVLKYEIHFTGLGPHSVAFNRVWGVLLLFPVSHSVDECVSDLPLHEVCRISDKSRTRQLLDGCRKLLQRLAARLECDLELRPVDRRQLVIFVTAFQRLIRASTAGSWVSRSRRVASKSHWGLRCLAASLASRDWTRPVILLLQSFSMKDILLPRR